MTIYCRYLRLGSIMRMAENTIFPYRFKCIMPFVMAFMFAVFWMNYKTCWINKIPVYRIRSANPAPQETKNNFLKKSNNLHRKPAEILWFQRVFWSEWLVSNQRPRGPKQEPKTFFRRFQWFFIISARIPLLSYPLLNPYFRLFRARL